jgi:hypothetical protein
MRCFHQLARNETCYEPMSPAIWCVVITSSRVALFHVAQEPPQRNGLTALDLAIKSRAAWPHSFMFQYPAKPAPGGREKGTKPFGLAAPTRPGMYRHWKLAIRLLTSSG